MKCFNILNNSLYSSSEKFLCLKMLPSFLKQGTNEAEVSKIRFRRDGNK